MKQFNKKSAQEIRKILVQFLEEHREHFPSEEIEEFEQFLKYEDVTNPFTTTFFAQVYEGAGLVNPKFSIYRQFVEIIKKNFNIQRPIVEVGSGILPILGDYLQKEQIQLGMGTVTVYDSVVWRKYPTKAILKKEDFTFETKISKESLLIGMFPCEATEMMIDKALEEQLDFCIALCGCNHSGGLYFDVKEYHQSLIEYLDVVLPKDQYFGVTYLPKRCFESRCSGYPILMSRKDLAPKRKILLPTFLKRG